MGFLHQEIIQFSADTNWISYNSIQFCCYLELAQTLQVKGSIPQDGPTSDTSLRPQVVSCTLPELNYLLGESATHFQEDGSTYASDTLGAINWGLPKTPFSGLIISCNSSQNTLKQFTTFIIKDTVGAKNY